MKTIDPPRSIEAEQSVIGGLLLYPKAWDDIADTLQERDFYLPEHRLIYRHISRLIEGGRQVDVITVAESIESTGKLQKIGGLPYLGALAQNVPTVANIKSYAGIVTKKRKERDFLAAIEDLNAAAESPGEIEQKIENCITVLNDLSEDKQTDPVSLAEATQNALIDLEARMVSGEEIHGLKTGLIDFDRKTGGLQAGDLIILAGRPSMGKTALAINIGEHAAIAEKRPVLVFSLEMVDKQLATRSLANQGSVNLSVMRSAKLQNSDWDKLTGAVGKISEAPLYIDSNSNTGASQMYARARRFKRKHNGLGLIIIDYLQLMVEGGDNRNNELSTITRKLKAMAKDLAVPVLCLSQLSREVEKRPNKRPLMSDLRDSGAIEQDADVIIFIYRDEYYNPDSPDRGLAEAIFAKQRMGEIGTVYLMFSGEYSRFQNFAGERITPPDIRRQPMPRKPYYNEPNDN